MVGLGKEREQIGQFHVLSKLGNSMCQANWAIPYAGQIGEWMGANRCKEGQKAAGMGRE